MSAFKPGDVIQKKAGHPHSGIAGVVTLPEDVPEAHRTRLKSRLGKPGTVCFRTTKSHWDNFPVGGYVVTEAPQLYDVIEEAFGENRNLLEDP